MNAGRKSNTGEDIIGIGIPSLVPGVSGGINFRNILRGNQHRKKYQTFLNYSLEDSYWRSL